ncbi:helix-turn-helix domain-containing protein [Nocardia sp. NPDC048505]|uniref:helix-turn-helix transcriptional regulator n=1 Tax=unclassified Nocardia TaxID=2637762 RepID=UPI0033D28488
MRDSAGRWSGGVAFTPGLMAFSGEIGDTAAHSHAAVQVLLVTRGGVELVDAAGRASAATVAVIPPGARHEVRAAPGTTGLLAYLDPDSVAGRAAAARLHGLPADRVRSWLAAAVPRPAPIPAGESRSAESAAVAVRLATGNPAGPPSLVELAAQVALSPSRLSHVFAAHMGLPYAAWRRWTRLRLAMDAVRAGASFTEAAHAAGFADSAHLTRTCRDLFGLTPTEALHATGWR